MYMSPFERNQFHCVVTRDHHGTPLNHGEKVSLNAGETCISLLNLNALLQ